jgi:hypothetical protein
MAEEPVPDLQLKVLQIVVLCKCYGSIYAPCSAALN